MNDEIKELAQQLGIDAVGVVAAGPMPEAEAAMRERIGQGYMAGLPWFTAERARLACNPSEALPWAQSIIAIAAGYFTPAPPRPNTGGAPLGVVSRYAWGQDYHAVLKEKLTRLRDFLARQAGREVRAKILVDTGPLAEREVARRAGLGWFGKSTNLLTPQGSWVFLGALITDLALEEDKPLTKSCGRCQVCLEKCPTGALVAPYVLDSSRCIALLTIELEGPIPCELRPLVGERIFGCDVCQEVCPVNQRRAQPTKNLPAFSPAAGVGPSLPLIPLMSIDEREFRQRFGPTPLGRAKRRGLLRNAAVALGNIGDGAAVPALAGALADPEPWVRGHAAWALGRIGGRQARRALECALRQEEDGWVKAEIEAALSSR